MRATKVSWVRMSMAAKLNREKAGLFSIVRVRLSPGPSKPAVVTMSFTLLGMPSK